MKLFNYFKIIGAMPVHHDLTHARERFVRQIQAMQRMVDIQKRLDELHREKWALLGSTALYLLVIFILYKIGG